VPIYEYQCTRSGERFEVQQKISDPPMTTCDQLSCTCGTPQPVTKMISAPAIMFKGTGWYITDYSDKMKEPGSKSENNGKPAEGNKAEPKTDTKTSTESGTPSTAPASSTAQSGTSGSSSSSGSGSPAGSTASSGSGSSTKAASNS
jgi:putative FmdB family regulatory protein